MCCAVFLSFFFLVLYSFFQSYPINQGTQLKEKRGRQYQRVAALQPPAIFCPRPATTYFVKNTGALEPISPSIATTTTVVASTSASQAQHDPLLTTLANSTTTTTMESYSAAHQPHQPPTRSKPSPLRKPSRSTWVVQVL